MRIVLKEGQTVPENPDLLEWALHLYKDWYQAYLMVWNYTEKVNWSSQVKFFTEKGGRDYLETMQEEGSFKVIAAKTQIDRVLEFIHDPILKKRMDKDEYYRRLAEIKDATITMAFKIHTWTEQNRGYFWEEDQKTDLRNLVAIVFPANPTKEKWEDVAQTIRHELQHFTQSFYAKLLGSKQWIGMANQNAIRGVDIQADLEYHQDNPVEMATDLQDEIETFLSYHPNKRIQDDPKQFIEDARDYVAGDYAASFFKHYLRTNKEVWKWAVGKFLSAIDKKLNSLK